MKNNIRVLNGNTHFRFLAEILRDPAPLASGASIRGWNWPKLLEIAADHAVLATISPRLLMFYGDIIPLEVKEFLAAFHELNSTRNKEIVSQLERNASRLNAIGIEPLALKGVAYLLESAYSNPDERLLLDIDLLVPAACVDDAYSAFLNQNYKPDIPDVTAFTLLHRPALTREDSVPLEVHHSLLDSHADLLDPAGIFARSRRIQLGSATIRLPSPEDQIVHLVAHSQVSHGYDQRIWPPLRAQYDLLCLVRHFGSALDWTAIRRRFSQHVLGPVLDLHLLQVHRTLGLELPYQPNLTAVTRLRWWRRRLLWKRPWVRFFDPLYLFQMSVVPRTRTALRLWNIPGGRRYLVEAPFRTSFYRRLFSSIRTF